MFFVFPPVIPIYHSLPIAPASSILVVSFCQGQTTFSDVKGGKQA